MMLEYVFPKYIDKSVVDQESFRVVIAKRQLQQASVDRSTLVRYCKRFFLSIGMGQIQPLSINLIETPIKRGFYHKIFVDNCLSDKRDIIWLKFTKTGYLGVIATSNDINLRTDNSSGKIITLLGEEWDEEIIIFPLANIPKEWNRQRIESGLGNYLIERGIPVLDYFSHNL
ncbi:TPA: hypothetical protein ACGO2G_001509 [Streptococcus suis]